MCSIKWELALIDILSSGVEFFRNRLIGNLRDDLITGKFFSVIFVIIVIIVIIVTGIAEAGQVK